MKHGGGGHGRGGPPAARHWAWPGIYPKWGEIAVLSVRTEFLLEPDECQDQKHASQGPRGISTSKRWMGQIDTQWRRPYYYRPHNHIVSTTKPFSHESKPQVLPPKHPPFAFSTPHQLRLHPGPAQTTAE